MNIWHTIYSYMQEWANEHPPAEVYTKPANNYYTDSHGINALEYELDLFLFDDRISWDIFCTDMDREFIISGELLLSDPKFLDQLDRVLAIYWAKVLESECTT